MTNLSIEHAFQLALQHQQAGRFKAAEQLYVQILAVQPLHIGATQFIGLVAYQEGRYDAAINLLTHAIEHHPREPAAYSNLGLALHATSRFEEAISFFEKGLAIRPGDAVALYNLGNTLRHLGQLTRATDCYEKALVLKPDYCQAWNNLGNARRDLGQLEEAISAFRQAIKISHYPQYHSNLIIAMLYCSSRQPKDITEELIHWRRRFADPISNLLEAHPNRRDPDKRLRIGFISPDFRIHVVGRSLLPFVYHRDRNQIELYCLTNLNYSDEITLQFQKHADHWIDVSGWSDNKIAHRIRDEEIDVLVDLSLHTADNRLMVFARKPAPVQVTYLAYCGSSGLETMDFRVSDPLLDPEDADVSHYSEKTFRLPVTYWCYLPTHTPPIAALPSITKSYLTFGCLNNFAKLSGETLAVWIEILAALPDSRLLIHCPDRNGSPELTRRLKLRGIDPDRLLHVERQPLADYLSTYSSIDIALDPFPYNGGITTLDALWMGVPVVTLSGESAVSRGGRTILSNIGLPELIAFDQEQYQPSSRSRRPP